MGEDSAEKTEVLNKGKDTRLSRALSELSAKLSGGTKEGGQVLMSAPEVDLLMEQTIKQKMGY